MHRNLIRSHGRRNWVAQFHSGQIEVDDHKGRGITAKLVKSRNSQLKAEKWPKHNTVHALSGPGTGLNDPFDSLPIGSNSHIQALLNHCRSRNSGIGRSP